MCDAGWRHGADGADRDNTRPVRLAMVIGIGSPDQTASWFLARPLRCAGWLARLHAAQNARDALDRLADYSR